MTCMGNNAFSALLLSVSANTMQTNPQSARSLSLPTSTVFCEFSLQTENHISEIITKSNDFTCHLDPIPTPLVKACLPSIISRVTSIINSSLSTGIVPPSLKVAIIRPTLEKTGLDCNNHNNYKPISNLPFLSKLLETVVASQLQIYLNKNLASDPFSSSWISQQLLTL